MWPQQGVQRLLLAQLLIANACTGFLEGWLEARSWREGEQNSSASLSSSPQEVEVERYDQFTINYTLSGELPLDCVNLTVTSTPKQITTLPKQQRVCQEDVEGTMSILYVFNTTKQGIVTLETVADPTYAISTEKSFVNLMVKVSSTIEVVADVVGWISTLSWDSCLVPLIIHNYRRKCVIGLSFDFLTFNIIGYSFYFIFNVGLNFIEGIQNQYYERHPTSILHVHLNDVIFPFFGVICISIQIFQCIIYERGNQRVSTVCRILSGLMLISAVIYAILVWTVDSIWWLDWLYWLSYIKLVITFVKYPPQIYINYSHKSTAGWNIWQVILDFSGGFFSVLQMFLLAYNYDDFQSILTDPTKLGLGSLSMFYNTLFFIQHFFLYRGNAIKKDEIEKEDNEKLELEDEKF